MLIYDDVGVVHFQHALQVLFEVAVDGAETLTGNVRLPHGQQLLFQSSRPWCCMRIA